MSSKGRKWPISEWVLSALPLALAAVLIIMYFQYGFAGAAADILPLFAGVMFLLGAWVWLLESKQPGWLAVFGQAGYAVAAFISIIIGFADAYNSLGLVESATRTEVHDHVASLYFSIITFTTTGYGDFVPTPADRLIAAFEALVGFIVMAALIGAFARIFLRLFAFDKEQAGSRP
jgi:Ion channel